LIREETKDRSWRSTWRKKANTQSNMREL
jgi:hypothetical protein